MELSKLPAKCEVSGKSRSAKPSGQQCQMAALWLSTLWAELLEKSLIAELEGLGGPEFFRVLEGDIKGPQV